MVFGYFLEMIQENPKQQWADDVAFVISECDRFQKSLNDDPKNFIKNAQHVDTISFISTVGCGGIMCGAEGLKRLQLLSRIALEQSDAQGTLDPQKVFQEFLKIFVQRFMVERRSPDIKQTERAFSSAIRFLKQTQKRLTYFIPCRVMYTENPGQFNIGPITFRTRKTFEEKIEPFYAAYLAEGVKSSGKEVTEILANKTKEYYADFTWVAEVTILNCDAAISQERATLAVTAAIDFLHLLFGPYHTRRMAVGGPLLANDARAWLTLDGNNRLEVNNSSSATSPVGLSDGWDNAFNHPDLAAVCSAAAKTIQFFTDPSVQAMINIRIIDVISWFGQAVRELSDAGRIIKSVAALERLVMTSEKEDITEILCERAAAIWYAVYAGESFSDRVEKLKRAYNLRSKLAHGDLSPFAAEVKESASDCLKLAEEIIRAAIVFFEEHGAFETNLTKKDLAQMYKQLINSSKNRERNNQDAEGPV